MASQLLLLALCLLMASRQACSFLSPVYKNQKRWMYSLYETSSGKSSTLTTNQQQIDEAWARLLDGSDVPSIGSFSSISSITSGGAVIDKPPEPPALEILESSPDIIPIVTSEPVPLDDIANSIPGLPVIEPILDTVTASTYASTLDPSLNSPTVQNALRVMFPGIKFNEVTSTSPSEKAPTLYEYIRDGKLVGDVSKDMDITKENAFMIQSQVQKIAQNFQDMITINVNELEENFSSWFKSIITSVSSNTSINPFLPSFPSALTNPNPTTTTIIAAASTVTMLAIYTQRREQQQIRRQQHQQEKQIEQQLKEANDKANQAVALAENAVNDLTKLRKQIERSSSSTTSQSLINKSKMEQLVIENDLYKQQVMSMERELQQLQAQLQKLLEEKLILQQYIPDYDLSEEIKEQRKKPPVQGKQPSVTITQEVEPPAMSENYGNRSYDEIEKLNSEKSEHFKAKKHRLIVDNKNPISINSPIIKNASMGERLGFTAEFPEGTMASDDENSVNVLQKKKQKGMVDDDAASKGNKVLVSVGKEIPSVGSKGIPTAQETEDELPAKYATESVAYKKLSRSDKEQQEKQKFKMPTLSEKVGRTRKGSALKIKKTVVKEAAKQEEKEKELSPSAIMEDSIYGKPHPWAALSDTTLSRKTISELTSFLSDRGAEVTANGKPLSKKEILVKVRSML